MPVSAEFTVNTAAVPPEASVSASSTVTLALTDTGFRTAAWSIVGNSSPSLTNPTITPAGSPLGATATFSMPAGTGQAYLVQCVVNGGRDDEGVTQPNYTKRAVIGVAGTSGIVPFCVGETYERDAVYGYLEDLNAVTDISGGTSTIVDNAITFAKMQDIGVGLIGNDTGTADPKLITLASSLAFAGGAVGVATAGVTLAMMANIATARFVGRVSGSTGVPEAMTGTQATTLLDVFTDLLKGLVPASGGGTTNFLRADATWAAPPGGGGSTSAAGLTYNFAASTTTSSNPGSGNFRLNNATLASVTGIALCDTDADGGANEAYLLAQDDSTTAAHRGYILIRSIATPATFAIYDITGASTDSSGWVQFVVTHVVSGGTMVAADPCGVEFYRTGDTGATGAAGSSGGAGGYASIVTESTTARTLVIGDANALIRTTNASATTVTFPPNSSVAFPIGTAVSIRQSASGQVTLAAGVGVTLNTPDTLKSRKLGSIVRAIKVAADEWDITGDVVCIIGSLLTDANQTLAVSGGDDYAQLTPPTANRTKKLSNAGATDNRIINIRRYDTAAFTITITDNDDEEIFTFAAATPWQMAAIYSESAGKWLPSGNKDLE
jgi:hypothetical protein